MSEPLTPREISAAMAGPVREFDRERRIQATLRGWDESTAMRACRAAERYCSAPSLADEFVGRGFRVSQLARRLAGGDLTDTLDAPVQRGAAE